MSLEWFDRVTEEIQDQLESICEKYDQVGHMSIDRGAKHPRMEFYVETDDHDREYFCSLNFDPHNEEFYVDSIDLDTGQASKVILEDIEDIVDVVHESIHNFINYDGDLEGDFTDDVLEDEVAVEFVDDDYDSAETDDIDDIFEEVDVEWETPEVTAFMYEDEVEVTYQFGIIQETGDGVLRRVNRIWTEDDDLIKDESHFIFSKEEASIIIAMIASHMDSLSDFEQ